MLPKVRAASERVLASMLVVFNGCAPGQTKNDLIDQLRREEVERGLTFEYCLMSAGKSFNRAPSDQRLESGNIFSLDSGGNYKGYIGDLCRMGILGEPDAELVSSNAFFPRRATLKGYPHLSRPDVLRLFLHEHRYCYPFSGCHGECYISAPRRAWRARAYFTRWS